MDYAKSHPAHDVFRRVQCEFLEMPGLRLTERQARRLWGLGAHDCASVLRALIDAGFLFRTRDGSFMRIDRAAPVKMELAPSSAPSAKITAA